MLETKNVKLRWQVVIKLILFSNKLNINITFYYTLITCYDNSYEKDCEKKCIIRFVEEKKKCLPI